jgi:hypothetical protein
VRVPGEISQSWWEALNSKKRLGLGQYLLRA